MHSEAFVFTINSRVVWIDENVFHIPVLHDLYRFHFLSKRPQLQRNEDCIDYVVPNFVRFEVEELVLNPSNSSQEREENFILFEKIRIYKNLCKFINESYRCSMPPVFSDEIDNIDILSNSLISSDLTLTDFDRAKHHAFIHELFKTKKDELKSRYIETVERIKAAHTIEEIQQINFSVVYRSFGII